MTIRLANARGKMPEAAVDATPKFNKMREHLPGSDASKTLYKAWAENEIRRASIMEQHIELEGTVVTVLPGTMFRVRLDNEHEVLAHISGKMRKRFIRLTAGDRVKIQMSPYDLDKARITYRLGGAPPPRSR
jgi:translation initiation factor IF-1